MIISHVKIIAFQTITNHSFWAFYTGGKPVVYIINRKIHGCLEIPDKPGISAPPCIILYIMEYKYTESRNTEHSMYNVTLLS